jgi:hypothetical protein
MKMASTSPSMYTYKDQLKDSSRSFIFSLLSLFLFFLFVISTKNTMYFFLKKKQKGTWS